MLQLAPQGLLRMKRKMQRRREYYIQAQKNWQLASEHNDRDATKTPSSLEYFKNLSKHGVDLPALKRHWQALEHEAMDTRDLHDLLHRIHHWKKVLPRQEADKLGKFLLQGGTMDLWFGKALKILPNGNIDDLKSSLHYLTELSLPVSPLFMKEFCSSIQDKLHKWPPQKLADIMSLSWKANYQPNNEFLQTLEDHMASRIQEFPFQTLTFAMANFARNKIRPGEEFLQAWTDQANRLLKNGENIAPQDLTSSLRSFAYLGLNPGSEFIENWAFTAARRLGSFNQSNLAPTLWSVAVLSASTGDPLLPHAAEFLFGRLEDILKSPSEMDKSQINLAALWFDYPEFRYSGIAHNENSSWIENKLCRMFEEAGITLCDPSLPELSRKADAALIQDGRKIIMEYDGPDHFVFDKEGYQYYDGGTRLQSALVAKLEPRAVVMRLDYDSVDCMFTRPPASFLKQLKEHYKWATSGVYESTIENDRLNFVSVLKTLDGPV